MNRSAPYAGLFGVKRGTDIIGKPYGCYVVDRYVGADASSIYVVVKCVHCGTERKRPRMHLANLRRIKNCSNCTQSNKPRSEAAE